MFPVKEIDKISTILLFYTDRYVVNKDYTIDLDSSGASRLGICKAYLNDVRPFEVYKGFAIDKENVRVIRKIKPKTIIEDVTPNGDLSISGTTTLNASAKGYEELSTTIRFSASADKGVGDRRDFLNDVWLKIPEMNFKEFLNSEKTDDFGNVYSIYEINVEDNFGNMDTIYISRTAFYLEKSFRRMSAALVDNFHPYQNDPNKGHAMIRVEYDELTLYLLVGFVRE